MPSDGVPISLIFRTVLFRGRVFSGPRRGFPLYRGQVRARSNGVVVSFPHWTRRKSFAFGLGALAVALVATGLVMYAWSSPRPDSLAFSEFVRQLHEGAVTEVALGDQSMTVTLRGGRHVETVAPVGYAANPAFLQDLIGRHVRVSVVEGAATRPVFGFGSLFMGLALVGVLGFIALPRDVGPHPGGREQGARWRRPRTTVVTFADVAGVDEAKEEVQEIVDFLREPGAVRDPRRPDPQGRPARRPPGNRQDAARPVDCGRGGSAVPVRVSGSDFVEMYAGVGAARVRKLFKEARRHRGLHRLHRRAGRRRARARRQLAQPRGARADAEPAARRDGRLRAATRASSSSPRPTGRTSSTRRCCGPADSTGRSSSARPT